MGGHRKGGFFRLARDTIATLYKSGPEAVVSLVGYLQDVITQLWGQIESQRATIEEQKKRIEELEAKEKKDSHNSSKPPSSDGLSKRKRSKPAEKRKKGRRPGGQKGHEGTTLRMVESPDKLQEHRVERCCECGKSLAEQEPIGYEKRQVFDVPEIKLEVTEHRAQIKECDACGWRTTGEFPEGVTQKAQYGQRVKSFAVYIKNYGLVPYERTAELLEDLFGAGLSAGTLVNMNREFSGRVGGVVEWIGQQIRRSPVVHFDETGMRIGGRLNWLHVAGTDEFTYYMAHEKRGKEAMDAMGILPGYEGRAVHDGWKSYFRYTNCTHALCNTHHVRELTFIVEQYEQQWAQRMIEFLLKVKADRDEAEGSGFADKQLRGYEREYREIIAEGFAANPPPVQEGKKKRGRKKKTDALNLLERLEKYEGATLAFMYDFSVPFSNNLGEQDIRMMKVQQKISGTFRSAMGALSFCRIRSYISTVKKHKMNVISAIQGVFTENVPLYQIATATAE